VNEASAPGLIPWHVRLFGSFAVERDGKTASFRTKKTASLFAYLAFYAGKRIRKEQLIDALWPDADSDKGRHSLRVALSSLRESFSVPGWDPSEFLLSDRETVGLAPEGFEIDVRQFRRKLKESKAESDPRGSLSEAVEVYGGLFLPGFSEEWILPQALELEEAYAQAVCDLVELLAKSGDLREAVSVGRKALGICPSREDLHVALMRAYSACGQPAQAIKQFEELERMLDSTWGEMPSDEAVAVLDSLPKRTAVPRAVIAMPDIEVARTAFVGREAEVADLCDRLQAGAGLVTLLGFGGTGKTRLAQRVGERLEDSYGKRVWFVSLVGVDSQEQVQEAVLAAVRPDGPPAADVPATIVQSIGIEASLLILDNLELIVPIAQSLIRSLTKGCPNLRVLATSRVPLDLEGETLVPLLPLELPSDFRDLNALRNASSVRLLVAAGQNVRPGFAVTHANAQSVLLLCQKLEGIPLALELAAAKLGTLSPAQVLGSMGRTVDLSTTRSEVREEHRSLRAVIEWSLGLLGEGEARSFARLGVCRGGFNHGLAEALLGGEADEHVRRLVRLALLHWTETHDEVRFEMLETVREIAFARLESEPQEFDSAVKAHFAYVQSLTSDPMMAVDPSRWTARMLGDSGNLHAAIEWGAEGRIDAAAMWLALFPLEEFIDRTGRPLVWITPLEVLLQKTRGSLPAAIRARAHALLAFLHYGRRNIRETIDHYQEAIAAADQTDDKLLRIDLRSDSISAIITAGSFDQAQAYLEEAIGMLGETGDPNAAANCHLNLAWVLFDRGREEDSEPLFVKSVAYAEQTGNPTIIAGALTGLACAVGHTRHADAQPIFDRCLELWRGAGLPARTAHALYYRGLIDYRHGHLASASSHIERGLRMFVDCGVALGQSSITICGTTLAAQGRTADALLCWGRAEAIRRRGRLQPMPTLQRDVDREGETLRDSVTPSMYSAATERAEAMTDREFVEAVFGPFGS